MFQIKLATPVLAPTQATKLVVVIGKAAYDFEPKRHRIRPIRNTGTITTAITMRWVIENKPSNMPSIMRFRLEFSKSLVS